MLQEHKNALLQIIQESGLEVERFYSEDESKRKISLWQRIWQEFFNDSRFRPQTFTVGLKETALVFIVQRGPQSFDQLSFICSTFKPGFPLGFWKKDVSFQRVKMAFKEWLDLVVKRHLKDSQLPDLWSQLNSYQAFFGSDNSATGSEKENFTDDEKQMIRNSIVVFRRLLNEHFSPSRTQDEFIKDRLDYLSKAVDKLNRFDWRGVALSTLLSIGTNLSVDKESGRILLSLFEQAFQSVTHLLR